MKISILGTESLGVRGLCCEVNANGRTFVIDPGVSLDVMRQGLPPHPSQIAIAGHVKKDIISALSRATDIVVSHYHGDHVPLRDPNPWQISLADLPAPEGIGFWCKGEEGLSAISLERRRDLSRHLGRPLPRAEGQDDGTLHCSQPVFHGRPPSRVMMSRIVADGETFVHASDMQLLDPRAVAVISAWQPSVLVASGPPLYLSGLSSEEEWRVWSHAVFLASTIPTLILDHHLLRSLEGLAWLERLAATTEYAVLSAAEYMGRELLLLEARREELYRDLPVPPGWHDAFARGEATLEGWDRFSSQEGRNK
jgi:predicted metallo-beta-lactamase superfamily hydrolase